MPALAMPFIYNLREDPRLDSCEWNISFKKSSSLEDLLVFVRKYPDRRINIRFVDGVPMDTLEMLQGSFDNVYLRVGRSDMGRVPELSERGLRFFPDIPCYDYTMLEALMMVGATDFYPHDDLLHDLPDVARISKDSHMGMRLVLNRIPATSPLRGSLPTHPIYMPQDRTYLDRWFSAYELDCGEPFRENMFNVLHRAWFERMEWKGDLSEINPDLAIQYMCPSILPDLVEKRARCHHRCVRMSGSRCDICNSVLDLSGRRPRFKRRDDGEEREDGGVAAER